MVETTPIRVMVVDDHAMVREGLTTFLEAFDDLELIGEASNGAEAFQRSQALSPDVVLMDLVMPEVDGLNAIRTIKHHQPQVHIIALTSFRDESLVYEAIQAGADGYLLKNISANDLARAIRTANAGRHPLAPEATDALIHHAVNAGTPTCGNDLTAREREILQLMALGITNPEIAKRLVVSRSTVKNHVSNILSKLGANSRTEAVATALKHHLVREP